MKKIIINKKTYNIKKFNKGGNNLGYIDFDKNKIGKIVYLPEDRKINKTLDSYGYNENPYREIEIHKECNKLVKEKLTSNLVKYYKYYEYENNIILIIEKYDGDLISIIDKLTLDELWSIFGQIFITFIILQDKLGFYQGDFGPSNILYKKVNKRKKFFDYNINGINYKIPNCGYKIVISDYGNAIIKKFILADYEKEYYESNLKKRIELYEILLLFNKYILKLEIPENYRKKYQKLQNIIYENVRFNLYNGIYTINREYTNNANEKEILNDLFK
jgi:serine/threonine protein kinase